MPVDLNGANVDFAVGRGDSYLNGSPGAPGYLFVAERHQEEGRQPLSAWMGYSDSFGFEDAYPPADGIGRFLAGPPPILALAALEQGVDLMAEADMKAVRHKSVLLTEALIAPVEQECAGHGFSLVTPREAARRGSQVCFRHPDDRAITQALAARGVIGNFRDPDILRFGFVPLYVRFRDVWSAVSHLRDIMESGVWDRSEFTQNPGTG